MKDLVKLGFTYDDEMDMFSANNIEQFKELINEKIHFGYIDCDNGYISGCGRILAIDDSCLDEDGEGHLFINFKTVSGSPLNIVTYRKDCTFADGEKFKGGIFAGDDMDTVLFKLIK